MRRRGGWNATDKIARAILFVFQGFDLRDLSQDQALPNIVNAASERRDPTYAGDAQTHRASLRRTIVAFVPPKPNEFEIAQSNCASRALFATMFRCNSDSRKFTLGGKN